MSGSQMMFLGSTKLPITFVANSSFTGAGTAGTAVTVPSGTLATDLMIICVASESGGAFTAPSGFTTLVDDFMLVGNERMAMYYKLGSVPTSTVTVYGNAATNDTGVLIATFRNVSAYNAFGYQTYGSTGNDATLARTSPDIASGTNKLQLFMLGKDTGATTDIMTPSQGTKIDQVNAAIVPDETVVCLAWNLGSSATTGTCLWSTSGTVGTAYGSATATFS
jgi:hypothetical protein